MPVNALDHINIITADLDITARFYVDLLGLERRDAPGMARHDVQWLHDVEGRAILHINSETCHRAYQRQMTPGPTGALHHVALNCTGHHDVLARLDARSAEWQANSVTEIGLRQIFTMDPNGVLLELNFFGD